LRGRYQYYTEANIHKLRDIGYTKPFTELEQGVEQYVNEFLMAEACY
jgi:ADP-L-glycero-D-manno-heptose 6-epimerase